MAVDVAVAVLPVPVTVPRTRPLAAAGMLGVIVTVCLTMTLHVAAAEQSPVFTMISDYALGEHRRLFDAAVLALVAGSVALLAALVRSGVARAGSGAAILLGTWCVAMTVVVVVPTCSCRVDVPVGGYVHAVASVVGFLALPLAALASGRAWRDDPRWGRHARWARGLAAGSLVWLFPLILGLVPSGSIAVLLWQIVPFGLIERGLAVTEMAILLVLGGWAYRAGSRREGPAMMAG